MTDNSLTGIELLIPEEARMRAKLSVAIANRIETLMKKKGLTKKQFADALGRRPSEITKWLGGEHNFTIASLARLMAFFGEPIIVVANQARDDKQPDYPAEDKIQG